MVQKIHQLPPSTLSATKCLLFAQDLAQQNICTDHQRDEGASADIVGALILKTVNASADSHTADFITAQVEDLFQDFDHTRRMVQAKGATSQANQEL
ncbi:hypothetical protein WJX77_011922 [Trebouxia sp. C0004]